MKGQKEACLIGQIISDVDSIRIPVSFTDDITVNSSCFKEPEDEGTLSIMFHNSIIQDSNH